MPQSVVFPGLGIGGYRCYRDLRYFAPLSRINVLVGPNNVGKSTALNAFLRLKALRGLASGDSPSAVIFAADERSVQGEEPSLFRLAWPIAHSALEQLRPHVGARAIEQLVTAFTVPGTEQAWIRLASEEGVRMAPDQGLVDELRSHAEIRWDDLSSRLTSTSGGGPDDDTRRVIDWIIREALEEAPETVEVPAHRQIRSGSADVWSFDGAGIIDRLDRIRNPELDARPDRGQHDAFIEAVQKVLELRAFGYHVARESKTLTLHIEGEHRSLQNVGTGIEHAILLIAASVVQPAAMLCVEEPEVHMHPRLQRRLAQYLREDTSNQLVVSTHSATFIDALQGNTFELEMDALATTVRGPVRGADIQALSNLGYRASDLLQTNYAIWVEGPSDRIYLRHWLSKVAPDLREGVDYSIIFYGGSLLARLRAVDRILDDDAKPDRVSLPRVNQRLMVVCDSDKTSTRSSLKPRVDQILKDVAAAPYATAWVTEGRTIENYVPVSLLRAGIAAVHPSTDPTLMRFGQWTDVVSKVATRKGTTLDVDKVALAEAVAAEPADLGMYDLHGRIENLVAEIREANR